MESCENVFVPTAFPIDYRNLQRYLPKEPEVQPLDFTIKKPPVTHSRNNNNGSSGFGVDSIIRPTSPVSSDDDSSSEQQTPPMDFARGLDHLKLLNPYMGMDPAAIPYLPLNLLGLHAMPPVLRENNVQSSGKKASKRKTTDLRPHQIAEKLIQQPIHRPRNLFPNEALADKVPVTLRNGAYPFRAGLNGSLLSNGVENGSSLSDRVQHIYNGRSGFTYDLPYNGLSSTRNGRSSPKSCLPSSNVSFPGRASSPSRDHEPSSPKGDHEPSQNGLSEGDLNSSLPNGLSSSKVGVTSSNNEESSNGDLTSPQNGISSLRAALTSPSIGLPKGDSTSSVNGLSSSKVGVTSSHNGLSSPEGTSSGQSTDQDRPQKVVTNGISFPSPDNGQFSPESSEMGRSSPITSSDVVDSSSGGCKRKKGNPVPEAYKDPAYKLKRQKNNEAAKKSREKRREHEARLTLKVNELHSTNQELKAENDRLYFETKERISEVWRLEQQLKSERESRARAEAQLKDITRFAESCRRCSELLHA